MAALISAAFLLLASACSHIDASKRQNFIAHAEQQGFSPLTITAGNFELLALTRLTSSSGQILSVYLEGDGAAWPTPYHPPRDPTPNPALSFMLATADPGPKIAYLGRACQYLPANQLEKCPARYWSSHRFSPEILSATNQAIDRLKAISGTAQVRLIGYSGGGVIAAQLAGQRKDIERLVTIAAPLALARWLKIHDLTPLSDTEDPLDQTAALPPALHFAGAADRIVPPALGTEFVHSRGGQLISIPGFDHECCWSSEWRRLLEKHLPYPPRILAMPIEGIRQ